MSKRTMESLKDILCKELDQYAQSGRVNGGDLEEVHMLTDTIKNLEKIIMLDEQGYSYDGGSSRGGSYRASSRGNSYGSGYAPISNRGYSNEASSRRGGRYSYGDDTTMITQKLEEIIDKDEMSPDEKNLLYMAMDILKK